MLIGYVAQDNRLVPLAPGAPLALACWIDLERPDEAEIAALAALGIAVPSLADMEEIEISNRLYHEGDTDFMTAVLPGASTGQHVTSMPVGFILSPQRLVTVRHHAPRPFQTFPARAATATAGIDSPERVFLGLIEEIVSRLADLLEEVGRRIDAIIAPVLEDGSQSRHVLLHEALRQTALQSEILSALRLGLLGVGRILTFVSTTPSGEARQDGTAFIIEVLARDVRALEVHADFLGQRAALTLDATIGMINVRQNETVRVLSVVAAMFLPPTLIASVYGMNFAHMEVLQNPWGYPMALAAMAASALATWVLLRWRGWK